MWKEGGQEPGARSQEEAEEREVSQSDGNLIILFPFRYAGKTNDRPENKGRIENGFVCIYATGSNDFKFAN